MPQTSTESTLHYTILQAVPKPALIGLSLIAFASFLAWTEQPIGALHRLVLGALILLFIVRLKAFWQPPRRGSLVLEESHVAWSDARSGELIAVPYSNLTHVVVDIEAAKLRLSLLGDDADHWPRHLALTAEQIEADDDRPVSLHELKFEIEARRRDSVARDLTAEAGRTNDSPAGSTDQAAGSPSDAPFGAPPGAPAPRRWYRYCPATLILTGLLTAIAVAEFFTFAFFNPITLINMGALSPPLVAAGEWWRMATGSLLHGNFLHLLLNGVGLLFLGYVVERAMGSARFLVIYLSACIGCSLASAWQTDALLSVGASGGLFGLVAAYSILHWRWSTNRNREARRQAFALAVTFISPALLVSNADHWGHAGGLVVGLVLAGFVYRQDRRDMAKPPNRWTRLAAIASVLLFTAAAAQAAYSFLALRGAPSMAILLQHTDDLPEILINEISWPLAINPNEDRATLELAKERMAWSRDQPEDHASQDTLATLLYRLQEFDAAIELQSSLPWQENPVYAAQLMRFLWARKQHSLAGSEAALEVRPPCGDSWSLTLGELSSETKVLLVFTGQQKAEVMAEVTLPAGNFEQLEIPLPEDFDTCRLKLSVIERWPGAESSPRGSWRFHYMVDEIKDLP